MQPICVVVIVSKGINTISPRYAWFQSSLSRSGKTETFAKDHTQTLKRISVGEAVTIIQQWGKTISSGIEADDLRLFCIDSQAFSGCIALQLVQYGLHVGVVVSLELFAKFTVLLLRGF
eukprot:278878-Pelagomonas_calceolata.AAC.1